MGAGIEAGLFGRVGGAEPPAFGGDALVGYGLGAPAGDVLLIAPGELIEPGLIEPEPMDPEPIEPDFIEPDDIPELIEPDFMVPCIMPLPPIMA